MADSTSFSAAAIAEAATVPEHSLPLMEAMGAGEPMLVENYLFFHKDEALSAIGYPLLLPGKISFQEALEQAAHKTAAREIFVIAPQLPPDKKAAIQDSDDYYALSATAPIPPRLRNIVRKLEGKLTVKENAAFTPRHRQLWTEFLSTRLTAMNERVASLYAGTPKAMQKSKGALRLLDAYDPSGNLCASLLLDFSPHNFCSYVIGAHSTKYAVPHAMDLLFARMIMAAKDSGKKFIHLGLGVNAGILRFKQKWGAKKSFHYSFAHWQQENGPVENSEPAFGVTLCRAILAAPDRSARQLLDTATTIKPFAMLWQVRKNNRVSWLGGTAHFFCSSFESSFRKLFAKVDNVIFEGPLDAEFMAKVNERGRKLLPGQTPMLEMLTKEEINALENVVIGKNAFLCGLAGEKANIPIDARHLLATGSPWYVFFTLWTTFLERLGWKESVDMEAWRIANDMGKNVVGMENLEEQLESLQSLPPQRAVNFFRDCGNWKKRARMNMRAYLAGDLEKMMGSSAEFPTRTEHIVSRRDQRFRERMRPWLEKGACAVFVGSAHLVNLRHMLMEDGFEVIQKPFGLWPKIHLSWRNHTRPDGKVKW